MFKLTLSVRNFVYYHQHHCRLFGKMTIVMMTMTVVMMTMIVVMMTMTVVMMTMTVATCLYGNWQVMSPTRPCLASLPLSLTYCTL